MHINIDLNIPSRNLSNTIDENSRNKSSAQTRIEVWNSRDVSSLQSQTEVCQNQF